MGVIVKNADPGSGGPISRTTANGRLREVMRRIAIENALKRCLSAAKLRQIRIHDLRHSYATIRLLKGHNIGDVSYQLGHSSISMTYDVYGHWIPGHFKSEVDELDHQSSNPTKRQHFTDLSDEINKRITNRF